MKYATRKRRRAARPKATPVKVGLFWVFKGRLLTDAEPFSEGAEHDGTIRAQADRADYWPTLQHVRSKLRPVDFEEIPRGRVLLMKASSRYCVYMDKALHKPKFKAALIREFALPKQRTDFLINPYYRTDPDELDRLFTR